MLSTMLNVAAERRAYNGSHPATLCELARHDARAHAVTGRRHQDQGRACHGPHDEEHEPARRAASAGDDCTAARPPRRKYRSGLDVQLEIRGASFDPLCFGKCRHEDQRHRCGWIPYYGGEHTRIGFHFGTCEVKAILHQMLRNYTWTVPNHYVARWDATSLLILQVGLPITLECR